MGRNFKIVLMMVIVAGLAAGAAFGAGTVYGRTLGPKPVVTTVTGGTGGTGGNAGAAGAQTGGAGGNRGTAGTVDSINGDVLTIRTQDGNTVKVQLSGDTPIRKTVDGTREDLKKGTAILVNGSTAADGTVTASQVSITPAGGAAGFPGAGANPSGTPGAGRQGGQGGPAGRSGGQPGGDQPAGQ